MSLGWQFDRAEARWMESHLSHFWDQSLVGIAPIGFETYGRLFHPAYDQAGARIRWRAASIWSGADFPASADFLHVALPLGPSPSPVPWSGGGPRIGTLDSEDARALIEVLRDFTTDLDPIWFGLWDGLGWDRAIRLGPGHTGSPADNPIPTTLRADERIQIPDRSYFLYSGPLEAALEWVSTYQQTPHLWWPSTHQWCVATEVDLSWSVVGGPTALIERLQQSSEVEVREVGVDVSLPPPPSWLDRRIRDAVQGVYERGTATIDTGVGSISWKYSPQRGLLSVHYGPLFATDGRVRRELVGSFDDTWQKRVYVAMLEDLEEFVIYRAREPNR